MKNETAIKNIDALINALFCDQCRRTVQPESQTRLSATECAQKTDYICWNCPDCGQSNFTEDDLSMLDDEIIEGW